METATERAWTLSFPDKAVSRVAIEWDGPRKDFEHWTWLGADIHYDSKDCDRDFYHRTMTEAVDRGASIIQAGDIFDIMQGPNDRRACRSALRDEYFRGMYFDEVVNAWVEDHKPYAHNLVAIGYGNHETAVMKNYQTDPIDRALHMLRLETGATIQPGGYEGAVWYTFKMHGRHMSRGVFYYHGSGGGGQVTRDTIGMERLRARVGDFDVLVIGHTHDLWADASTQRKSLTAAGKWRVKRQISIKPGTFKANSTPGRRSDWETERGIRAKATGGYWLRWFWDSAREDIACQEVRMA